MLFFRLKFTMMSLAIWLMLAGFSAWLVLSVWYPAPLHQAANVLPVFMLMLAMGFILGPVLTFLIAKPNKKSLLMDWGVVLLLMLSAFAYGVYHLSRARPVYLAFDVNRFELVRLVDIVPESQLRAAELYQNVDFFAPPKWVAVRPADDDTEFFQRFLMETNEQISATAMPEWYQSLDNNMPIVLHEAKSLMELQTVNQDKIQAIKQQYPQADKWLPLLAKQKMIVLIDSKQKQIVGVAEFW